MSMSMSITIDERDKNRYLELNELEVTMSHRSLLAAQNVWNRWPFILRRFNGSFLSQIILTAKPVIVRKIEETGDFRVHVGFKHFNKSFPRSDETKSIIKDFYEYMGEVKSNYSGDLDALSEWVANEFNPEMEPTDAPADVRPWAEWWNSEEAEEARYNHPRDEPAEYVIAFAGGSLATMEDFARRIVERTMQDEEAFVRDFAEQHSSQLATA
jgi:hypothetical protein